MTALDQKPGDGTRVRETGRDAETTHRARAAPTAAGAELAQTKAEEAAAKVAVKKAP
jgi:hypothetical protein